MEEKKNCLVNAAKIIEDIQEAALMARQGRRKNSISVGSIAGYCMVTPITVRRWIKGGKLSAIRLPSGHYRITLVDFRGFLKWYNMPIKEELFESKSEKKGGKK